MNKQFENLECWKNAIDMATEIYSMTKSGKFKNDFGLSNQIQRAIVSVSSNIVEGFERDNNKEFTRFLKIAKGSVGEVRSQLYVARNLEYIDQESFNKARDNLLVLSKQIAKFISYLKQNINS